MWQLLYESFIISNFKMFWQNKYRRWKRALREFDSPFFCPYLLRFICNVKSFLKVTILNEIESIMPQKYVIIDCVYQLWLCDQPAPEGPARTTPEWHCMWSWADKVCWFDIFYKIVTVKFTAKYFLILVQIAFLQTNCHNRLQVRIGNKQC